MLAETSPLEPAPKTAAARSSRGLVAWLALCLVGCASVPPAPVAATGRIVSQAWGLDPVYVIDARSGTRIGELDVWGYAGAAALVGNVVYVVNDPEVVALDVRTGAKLKSYEHDSSLATLLAVDDERLFVIASSGPDDDRDHVVAIDRRTLKRMWQRPLPDVDASRERSTAPQLGAGLLLVPQGSELHALDPLSGRRVWVHRIASQIHWPTAGAAGVFFIDDDGTVHALDPEHGDEIWTHRSRHNPLDDPAWPGAPLGLVDGLLLFCDGRSLLAIEAATRALRWRIASVWAAAVGSKVVFVKLGEERYGAVDIERGRLRWQRAFDFEPSAAPLVADSDAVIVVRPSAAELHGIDAVNGALMWSFDLDSGERVVAAVRPSVRIARRR
jgi:outer membrane protein assembly factor BamB